MGRKMKSKILIEIETDFDDEQSDNKTIKYCLKEDLQDSGWQVNKVELLHQCSMCKNLATGQSASGQYYCDYHWGKVTE